MERYGEKLTRLIKEAGYKKPNDFYKKVKELYGTETFARFTLNPDTQGPGQATL